MFVNQQDMSFSGGGVGIKKKKDNCEKNTQIFGSSKKKQYLCTRFSPALYAHRAIY